MKIGELAKLTDCAVETIRYYERENLLPEPARSDGNYRVYTQAHAERLTFIRNCRTLDMTLEEIRSLLAFRDSPQDQCESVNALIDEHIHHVKATNRMGCWPCRRNCSTCANVVVKGRTSISAGFCSGWRSVAGLWRRRWSIHMSGEVMGIEGLFAGKPAPTGFR